MISSVSRCAVCCVLCGKVQKCIDSRIDSELPRKFRVDVFFRVYLAGSKRRSTSFLIKSETHTSHDMSIMSPHLSSQLQKSPTCYHAWPPRPQLPSGQTELGSNTLWMAKPMWVTKKSWNLCEPNAGMFFIYSIAMSVATHLRRILHTWYWFHFQPWKWANRRMFSFSSTKLV